MNQANPLNIVIIWPVIVLIKCLIDWYQIKVLKKSPPHGIEFVIMCIIAFLYCVFVAGIHSYDQNEFFGYVSMYLFFSYVTIHDLLVNTFIGRGPLYIGNTAWIDVHVWHRWPNFYTWSKIISLILALVAVKWIYEASL